MDEQNHYEILGLLVGALTFVLFLACLGGVSVFFINFYLGDRVSREMVIILCCSLLFGGLSLGLWGVFKRLKEGGTDERYLELREKEEQLIRGAIDDFQLAEAIKQNPEQSSTLDVRDFVQEIGPALAGKKVKFHELHDLVTYKYCLNKNLYFMNYFQPSQGRLSLLIGMVFFAAILSTFAPLIYPAPQALLGVGVFFACSVLLITWINLRSRYIWDLILLGRQELMIYQMRPDGLHTRKISFRELISLVIDRPYRLHLLTASGEKIYLKSASCKQEAQDLAQDISEKSGISLS